MDLSALAMSSQTFANEILWNGPPLRQTTPLTYVHNSLKLCPYSVFALMC